MLAATGETRPNGAQGHDVPLLTIGRVTTRKQVTAWPSIDNLTNKKDVVTNLYGTLSLILLGVFGDYKFANISNQL
ncbi:hypothetical protein TNCV_4168221 [Trichonephila clavipes]|nr:hypothetical protein TNCV_4168221 [Trichonephila clavipes]